MADRLTVAVISPERTVFQGSADEVVVPAWDGKLGILRGHAPALVLLGEGELKVVDGTTDYRFQIAGGFLQVVDNVVTVLSERASAS